MPLLDQGRVQRAEGHPAEGDRGHHRAEGRQPRRSRRGPGWRSDRSCGSIRRKGYDLASVTLLEGGNPGDTKIVIEIFEGPKVKIGSINFVGNDFASDATLRTHISTRKPILGLFGKYHRDMLDEDRQKLIDYYYSQGFFEVKVTPVTRPGDNPGKVDLTFVVSEGTRYKVRNVIIEGNTKIKTEVLREGPGAALGQAVHDGGARSRQEPDARSSTARSAASTLRSTVEPRFTNQLGVVDLVYKIEEGEPYMLGELRDQGQRADQGQGDPPRGGAGGTVARRGPGQEPDRDLPAAADDPGVLHERPAAGQADQDRDRGRAAQGQALRRSDDAAVWEK